MSTEMADAAADIITIDCKLLLVTDCDESVSAALLDEPLVLSTQSS